MDAGPDDCGQDGLTVRRRGRARFDVRAVRESALPQPSAAGERLVEGVGHGAVQDSMMVATARAQRVDGRAELIDPRGVLGAKPEPFATRRDHADDERRHGGDHPHRREQHEHRVRHDRGDHDRADRGDPGCRSGR